MESFSFRNKTIIILSQQDWGNVKLSKHLYASCLSKDNTVFFLYTVPTEQTEKVSIEKITDSLSVIRINQRIKGIKSLPSFMLDVQSKKIVNDILKKINLKNPDVVWSFEQSRFQNLKQFNAKLIIFQPVDYIKQAIPFLSKIANSSDVVFSISNDILTQIKTKTPKHFIHHGIDGLFLNQEKSLTIPDFINPNKISVGYVGNLQIKLIDWKNMIKTVEENKNLNFIFIGPDQPSNIGGKKYQPEINSLKNLENTFFTGALSKEKLVEIMPHFDIFWLCYDYYNFPMEVSNSHKIIEYLSTGKVVVSNFISTYKNSSLIEMTDNKDISKKISEIADNLDIYNSPVKITERRNFAENHSYAKNISEIEKIINQIL